MRGIKNIFSALVIMVFGIVMIVISAGEMSDYAKKGEYLASLRLEDIKEGMMIEGDLPYNYGCYEQVQKENGKEGFGFYYLIDVGDEGFMGLYTAVDDLIEKLDAQYAALESSPDGTNIPVVHFKGKVTKMDSEDSRLYQQALLGVGLSYDFVESSCLKLYIKCVDTGSHPVILIIGIAATVIGLVLLLVFIRRKMIGR